MKIAQLGVHVNRKITAADKNLFKQALYTVGFLPNINNMQLHTEYNK